MDIGNRIRSLRLKQGLTQEQFAQKFHVSRQSVSNWENNRNYPDLGTLSEICDTYGLTLDEFLRGDEELIHRIDHTRKQARRGKWAIILAAVLAAALLAATLVPQLIDGLYYNPEEAVYTEKSTEKEVEDWTVSRMQMDMLVWEELFLPVYQLDTVNAQRTAPGTYTFSLGQSFTVGDRRRLSVSGQIQRGRLLLFRDDVLRLPATNAFEWTIGERDVKKSLERCVREGGGGAQGMAGGPKKSREWLQDLKKEKLYIGYFSFNRVMSWEELHDWEVQYDLGDSWAGIATGEHDLPVIGMYTDYSGSVFPYDQKKYPFLLGYSWKDGDIDQWAGEQESTAKQHFLSMLSYLSQQQDFLKMTRTQPGMDTANSYDLETRAEYVRQNGLQVYGVAAIAEKGELQKIAEDDRVYSVAAELY